MVKVSCIIKIKVGKSFYILKKIFEKWKNKFLGKRLAKLASYSYS